MTGLSTDVVQASPVPSEPAPGVVAPEMMLTGLVQKQSGAFVHAFVITLFLSVFIFTGSIFVEQINDRVLPRGNVTTLVLLFIVLIF